MYLHVKNVAVIGVSPVVLADCAGTGNKALRAETEQSVLVKFSEGKATKSGIFNN